MSLFIRYTDIMKNLSFGSLDSSALYKIELDEDVV